MKAYWCNHCGATSLYIKDKLIISPSSSEPGFHLLTSPDNFKDYNEILEDGRIIKELDISEDLINGILKDKKEFDESNQRMKEKGKTLMSILNNLNKNFYDPKRQDPF